MVKLLSVSITMVLKDTQVQVQAQIPSKPSSEALKYIIVLTLCIQKRLHADGATHTRGNIHARLGYEMEESQAEQAEALQPHSRSARATQRKIP